MKPRPYKPPNMHTTRKRCCLRCLGDVSFYIIRRNGWIIDICVALR